MRPLRLVIRAFGPYAAEETVDFRPLGSGALFLICGSTGAGKSTIIDAMAFALYGEACSEDRDGRGSRSHLAAPDRATEIEFDFALGPECYRVVRRPDQERPKKRGEGTAWERQSAGLWRRTALPPGDDLLEGEPLAARWEAVNEKIAALLGFDCEQFRQVIVLPQGRFRDLLTADVVAREEIFEKLFRTSIYSSLQERLKERARGIEAEHEMLETRRGEILRQAGAESPEFLAERRADTAAEISRADEAGNTLTAGVVQERVALDSARAVAVRFVEQADAVTHFQTQQTRSENLTPLREELRLARLAEPMDPFVRAVSRRDLEWRALCKRLETASGERRENRRLATEAQERLIREDGTQPEREEIAARLGAWQGLVPKVAALAELTTRLGRTEKAAALRREESAAARRQRQEIERAQDEGARERLACEQQSAFMQPLAAQLESAERDATRHALLGQHRIGLAFLENSLRTRLDDGASAEAKAACLQAELSSLETAQRAGRAALLAMQLAENAPCPVCGSQHHPEPASSHIVPPSDEQIMAAQRAAAVAADAARQARETVTEESGKVTAARSLIGGLMEMMGERAARSEQEVRAEIDNLRATHTRARAAHDRLQTMASEHVALRRRAEEARDAWPGIEQAERAAELEAQGVAAERAALGGDVPEELRSSTALETRIRHDGATLKALQQAHETARQAAAETLRRADAEDARVEELTARVREASAAADEARAELRSKLAAAGFSDEASLRHVICPPERVQTLENDLRAADDAFAAARERRERAAGAVSGLSRPDVAACELRFQSADEALRRHIAAAATLRQRGAALSAAADSLASIDADLARVRAQYEIFGTLSEAANGRNGRNLTLQRYVLGALLDDVLVAATRRLLVMSRGRFRLLRQAGRTDGRAAAGLALEVLDEWTGKLRPAGTLSGGESFLAALSLALGLADVVQAYAGGVRMEAMFIDEGFGSLDPEALDFAFQALLDLQRGGRLVGIISHVEELRQRIDVRLEIRASRRGSTAKFVGLPETAAT